MSRAPRKPLARGRTAAGGGPGSKVLAGWHIGTVIHAYKNDTYKVKLDTGRLADGVRRVRTHASDVELLPRLSSVIVNDGLPTGTVIMGVLDTYLADTEDPLLDVPDARVAQILPGDRHITSPDGNTIAVLRGGVNVMKSAANAEIRTHADGHVDVLSGTFKHFSSFGEAEIASDGVTTNYALRGGTHIQTHSGVGTENAWTLRVDAGSVGELLDVRVTTPADQTLSRFKMSSDGALEVYASGGRHEHIALGDVRVVSGEDRLIVESNATHEVRRKLTTSFGEREQEVMGTDALTIGGNQSVNVGGDRQRVVNGSERKLVQSDVIQDVGGTYTITLAAPTTGAAPLGQNFSWINYGGGYNFVVQPSSAGGFNVVSPLPGSVNLGVSATAARNPATGGHTVVIIPGAYTAVLFERLETFLKDLMSHFDKHTHPTAVGPTIQPVEPMSVALSAQTATFQSQIVRLGG